MRITIVNGFFLPVPPASGGSTEKTWYTLARIFAERGHEVVSISRRWPGFAETEVSGGVRHLRLPGFDHHSKLYRNLIRDILWSWRVFRSLPASDIVVCNAVTLPIWLGLLKPSAGRVVVMAGRMPKGQYGYYSRLARIMAPSEFVSQRLVTKNGKLEPIIRTTGYPIDWSLLSEKMDSARAPIQGRSEDVVTVGFVGRLHSEKGLLVLADAVRILGSEPGIPPFQVLICGPSDTARGGSGTNFRERVVGRILEALEPSRLRVVEPQFDERVLATIYQSIDVFCYPSLPSAGETFGVGVAEAMAAGAVPVVSGLPCFRDFVKDGINGLVFDNSGGDSAIRLASVLKRAIQDTGLRQRLSAQARSDVRRYDFPVFADRLLADFATLAPG